MFPENNGDATSTTSSPRGIDDCVAALIDQLIGTALLRVFHWLRCLQMNS